MFGWMIILKFTLTVPLRKYMATLLLLLKREEGGGRFDILSSFLEMGSTSVIWDGSLATSPYHPFKISADNNIEI